MTIRELIKNLEEMNQDSEVHFIASDSNDNYDAEPSFNYLEEEKLLEIDLHLGGHEIITNKENPLNEAILEDSILQFIFCDPAPRYSELTEDNFKDFQLTEEYEGYSFSSIQQVVEERLYEFKTHKKAIEPGGAL